MVVAKCRLWGRWLQAYSQRGARAEDDPRRLHLPTQCGTAAVPRRHSPRKIKPDDKQPLLNGVCLRRFDDAMEACHQTAECGGHFAEWNHA
jgi:hypothetical protein